MEQKPVEQKPSSEMTPRKEMALRFIEFVMMQAQNALLMMGAIPGARVPEPRLEPAKMIIDQLLMIREKTKGNLSKKELEILDDTVEQVSMAFTEISGGTPPSLFPGRPTQDIPDLDLGDLDEMAEPSPQAATASPAASSNQAPTSEELEAAKKEEEGKKKFFKSYG